jgi:hypothetical protein
VLEERDVDRSSMQRLATFKDREPLFPTMGDRALVGPAPALAGVGRR